MWDILKSLVVEWWVWIEYSKYDLSSVICIVAYNYAEQHNHYPNHWTFHLYTQAHKHTLKCSESDLSTGRQTRVFHIMPTCRHSGGGGEGVLARFLPMMKGGLGERGTHTVTLV